MTRVSAADLRMFALDVLRAAGMSAGHAEIVADTLVYADLRGVGTHGVARLLSYVDRVAVGVMEIDPEMPLSRDSPSVAVLDAANGFGQLAATLAMDLAVEKSRVTGIGAVSVAHSNHFGVAGYFVDRAARAGAIGIAMTNASPAMAPHNTTVPLLGTNPLAIGIPAASRPAIVLDMSSSLVARGKIRRAFMQGETSIPAGWAYDADGRPTTDPAAALRGLLTPIGGPKGAGLSLVIDILSGVLSGTGSTGEVANITDVSRPSGTGHLLIALDIAHFLGRDGFETAVDAIIDRIKALPAATSGAVYLPGEIEHDMHQRALEDGVALAPDVVEELHRLGDRYGITPPL
jgi:LDH2 family malate/lactate/ureidoglycolate dehydrogenase